MALRMLPNAVTIVVGMTAMIRIWEGTKIEREGSMTQGQKDSDFCQASEESCSTRSHGFMTAG